MAISLARSRSHSWTAIGGAAEHCLSKTVAGEVPPISGATSPARVGVARAPSQNPLACLPDERDGWRPLGVVHEVGRGESARAIDCYRRGA